jgi:addiction module RelE/StbE family toxin
MWRIVEHGDVRKAVAGHKIPKDILKRYEVWKDHVVANGPSVLRALKGLRDHSLQGEWLGFRSSYLGDTWRVIYKVDREKVLVNVERVSPHDYRR